MRSFRAKPVGWRYESAKHALAARGIASKYRKEFPNLVKPFEGENPRITEKYARFRQEDPNKFVKGSFRTKDEDDKKLIFGKYKGSKKYGLQSILVDRKKYFAIDDGLKIGYDQLTGKFTVLWGDYVMANARTEEKAQQKLEEYRIKGNAAFAEGFESEYFAVKREGYFSEKEYIDDVNSKVKNMLEYEGVLDESLEDREQSYRDTVRVLHKLNKDVGGDEYLPLLEERARLIGNSLGKELHDKIRREEFEEFEKMEVGKSQVKGFYAVKRVLKKGKIHVTKSGAEVRSLAAEVVRDIRPYAERVEIGGSIRRGNVENPVDIDIVTIPKDDVARGRMQERLRSRASKVYQDGEEKFSGRIGWIKTDVIFSKPEEFGAQLLTATGSAGHNIGLRLIAQKQDMKLNQHGLYKGSVRVAGKTEREIYKALHRPKFKKPEERE